MQTKPTANQILDLVDEDSDDLEFISNTEDIGGKYVNAFVVYKHTPTGTFWEITKNSSYWGDVEHISTDAYEVTPVTKMQEVTTWVAVV